MKNVNKEVGAETQALEKSELDLIEMTLAELQSVAGGSDEVSYASSGSW